MLSSLALVRKASCRGANSRRSGPSIGRPAGHVIHPPRKPVTPPESAMSTSCDSPLKSDVLKLVSVGVFSGG